jgi:1-acyl-sn-glycerol-3-phosphate acyltransferase
MEPQSTIRSGLRALGLASVTGAECGALWLEARLRGVSVERRDAYVRSWSRGMLAAIGARVIDDPALTRLPPVPPNGRLIVSNHRSMLDILVLLSRFGGSILSKDDLQRWPLVDRLAAIADTLYVDRSSSASGATSIRRVGDRLAHGRAVTVFAEGTTYPGDEVRPFHGGGFLAVARTGGEVLPVGLAYREPEAIYWQESIGQHGRRLLEQPSITVAMSIGEIIPPEGQTTKRLTALTHAAVQSAVGRARARL